MPWRRLGWVAWRRYRTTLPPPPRVLAVIAVSVVSTVSGCGRPTPLCMPCSRGRSAQLPIRLGDLPRRLRRARLARRVLRLARADRGLRGRAAAGPRAGDRHLPLRLDPRRRPDALGCRPAGPRSARRRRRPRGRLRRSGHLAQSAAGRQRASCPDCTPAIFPLTGLAAAGGRWSASPSVCWPACSGAASCPPCATASPPGSGWRSWPRRAAAALPAPLAPRPACSWPTATCPTTSGGPGGVRVSDAQINQALQAIGFQMLDGGGSYRPGRRRGLVDPSNT